MPVPSGVPLPADLADAPPAAGPPGRALQGRTARLALAGAALVVVYLVANAALPGHLPAGVVLKGVVLGGLQAMVAMGLVLLYRSARIVNFAQGAIGVLGLTVVVVLISGEHWSYAAAVPTGLAVTVAVGWGTSLLVRRFAESSRMIFTVATIGLAELLNAANVELPRAVDLRSTVTFATPFSFRFAVYPLAFTGDALVAMGAVVVLLVALWAFFQRTETGVAIRAAADNRERALLLGIPVHRLSTVSWMVAAGLAGVGAILSAPITGVSVGQPADPSVLLAPLAAAVLAGMESLPLTVVWSIILSIVDQSVFWSFHNQVYSQIVFFVLVMVAMVGRRSTGARQLPGGDAPPGADRVAQSGRWDAVVALRRTRRVLLAAMAVAAAVVPLAFSAPTVVAFQYVAIYGILALSLVVLSGWAGQISLAQYAFAGIGAAATGTALVRAQLPLPLAMVVAAAVGAGVACLLGLPALRIRGLYLAVATMAFAVPVSSWLLSPSFVPWLNPVAPSIRPPILFHRFDLASPWTFYELCLGLLLLSMWAVHNLRRSRTGRIVVAVRDNPRASAAYGISPLRARLLAFAVAGALAGVAGSLIVVSTSGMPAAGFSPSESVDVFAMAVIGGLGSITGAVAGAVYAQGVVHFLPQVWRYVADGGGLLVLLMVMPEGLAGVVARAGDLVDRALEHRLRRGRSPADEPQGPPVAAELGAAHTAALRMGALEDLEVAEQAAPDASPPDARPAGRVPLVDLDGVSVHYGRSPALVDVSLGVAQAEVLAILGTNGAGKSTALRVLAGLVRPSRGTVRFLGEDITRWSTGDRVAAGIATVLGGRSVFGSLSVLDNLRMGAWTVRHRHGDTRFTGAATQRVLDLFPALRPRLHQPAGLLSGGEQQMLALAQSLLCRPKVLLVDELSLGLAPTAVADILDVLRDLVDSGITVVVVEQSVNVATAISQRAVFVERGRVRFSGPTPALSQQPELLRSVFLHAADRAGRRHVDPGAAASAAAALAGLGAAGAHVFGVAPPGIAEPVPVPEQDMVRVPVPSPATAVDVAALIAGVGTGDTWGGVPGAAPQPEGLWVVEAHRGTGSWSETAPQPVGPLPERLRSVDDVAAALAGLSLRHPDHSPGPAPAVLSPPVPSIVSAALHDTFRAPPPADPSAAFAVVAVSKCFGGVDALRGVSLQVASGEILGVIGANGAGKTTLFDVCSGFSRPDHGRVLLHGRDVTDVPPAGRAALGLGRVFQDVRLWPTMTVEQALATALERQIAVRDPLAGALGLAEVADAEAEIAEHVAALLREFGLTRFAHRVVQDLSTGMRRIAEVACAVAHRPTVLLLDEPTAGIAQREAGALGELILGLREETGAAFVIIEHDVPLVASVADRLACMHLGEVIADGATESVLQDSAVVASYLASADTAGDAGARLVGSGSPR